MKKLNRLLLSLFLSAVFLSSTLFFESAVGESSSQTSPVVAINVSEYTQAQWANPSWKYFAIYGMLEEALKSDGTPFVEISDASIESGGLLVSGDAKVSDTFQFSKRMYFRF